MATKIEQVLVNVYGVKKSSKDTRQDFLAKIAKAAEDGSDAQWNKLSDKAQVWANKAMEAHAADKDIPDFPEDDMDGDKKAPAKKSTAKADKDDAKPPKTEKAPAKKAAPDKADKKTPAKKSSSEESSAVPFDKQMKVLIKRMILKKPTVSVDEIVEGLVKKGVEEPSKFTVISIRAEFRHSLKVLNADGLTNISL